MGRLYFVRHGESEWNVLGRICGSTDIPLTDRGREMARETGRKIVEEGLKIDKIISSPLSRAYETATIIASFLGLEVKKDDRRVGGAYEGGEAGGKMRSSAQMAVFSYFGHLSSFSQKPMRLKHH